VRILAVLAVLAVSAPAFAHQTSVKYVELDVTGSDVAIRFRVSPADVTEPMGLPPDGKPTALEAAASPKVGPYVARWLVVSSHGTTCVASAPMTSVDGDARFAVIAWTARCGGKLDELSLDFAGFFAVDHRHVAILRFQAPGADAVTDVVRFGQSPVHLHVGEPPEESLLGWIKLGVEHISEGTDHIAFVLALLLIVVLARTPAGWTTRQPIAALKTTAAIVTAFTISHSLSLIAASLGLVELRSTIVEPAIAVTIIYTAIEDVAWPDVRWRFFLAFGFGLVHGLGFASVLGELLPPTDIVAPLLLFNLGIEMGQLAIVLIALPVLYALAIAIGAERYRRIAMPALAMLIFAFGVKWLIERM
jgi:hypothetical protein